MNLQDKTILITGASRGIGQALAIQLAELGAKLILCGRDKDALNATARQINYPVTTIVADLGSAAGISNLCEVINQGSIQLDIVINNAGVQTAIDLSHAVTDQQLTTEFDINLLAPIRLNTALLKHISQPGGCIVNLSSILALQPKASAPLYCASKAGLRSYTLSLRQQLKPLGIKVIEVLPPLVATQMTSDRRDAQKATPAAVAKSIIRGLSSGKLQITPGLARLVVALNRLLPSLVAKMMMKA